MVKGLEKLNHPNKSAIFHPSVGRLTNLKQRFGSFWQAVMVVADQDVSLTITGNGDVLEPHDGIIGKKEVPASTIDDWWIILPRVVP